MDSDVSVVHLNVTDGGGGAARAAYRLHRGLLQVGIRSTMLVNYKAGDDPTVVKRQFRFLDYHRTRLHPYADKVPLRLYPQRKSRAWSTNLIPRGTARCTNRMAPNVVNLHWIGDGFVSLSELTAFDAPLVWTLHDMWPFTGGCHYDENCGRYRQACGACPQLGSGRDRDLSRRIWNRKHRSWRDVRLSVVAPSQWLADCARESSLFGHLRVETIPNGIDLDQYRPRSMSEVRETLGLPRDRKIILFAGGPLDRPSRKGAHYLREALEQTSSDLAECMLVSFGGTRDAGQPSLPLPVRDVGRLDDDDLIAALYAAADVFVAPSVQDNLPNTVMEALACGTPVVAFDIGGMPDMIEHRRNGYLAQPFQVGDLAAGLAWVLKDSPRLRDLSAHARYKAEQEFSLELQAHRYAQLYTEILKAHS